MERFYILLELLDGIGDLFQTWKYEDSLKSKVIGIIITLISISIGVYMVSKIYG